DLLEIFVGDHFFWDLVAPANNLRIAAHPRRVGLDKRQFVGGRRRLRSSMLSIAIGMLQPIFLHHRPFPFVMQGWSLIKAPSRIPPQHDACVMPTKAKAVAQRDTNICRLRNQWGVVEIAFGVLVMQIDGWWNGLVCDRLCTNDCF